MKAIGIILAGGNSFRMKELGNKRAIAAMPVAASYRAVDFSLSSMSNSGVARVAVMTQYSSRSLHEHLSTSKWWNFGQKMGGLVIFTPTITMDNGFWYRGTADAIYQNLSFLRKSHEPYVIIAQGDGIYKIDYNKVLERHIETKADITIVTKELSEDVDVTRYGHVKLSENGELLDFEEKPENPTGRLCSTGIYIIRRRLLMELVEQAVAEGHFDLVNDVILRNRHKLHIYGYKLQSYWASISSVADYYRVNMDFLKPEVRNYFFKEYPDVYSVVGDMPPAKYNPGSNVYNSLFGSGSIINGSVSDSVIGKRVFVGNDCTIKNSIILHDVYIGDHTTIENCILEARDTIQTGSRYIGEGEPKIVIEKNDRY